MINRAEFMANILEFATRGYDPDTVINNALKYMGRELGADRAYVFEEVSPGSFDNTYEWCAEGAVPQIENLKGLPYDEVVKPWYDEYRQNNNIFITDLEAYKEVCLPMYEVLKPQDINTLISGPIELDDKYVGFFGVDNPPLEMMREISTIITLLAYAFSLMMRYRNDSRRLHSMLTRDPLTGIENRHSFEIMMNSLLQDKLPTDLIYIAFDLNGLKQANDTLGHAAGDELIKGAAECIKTVYGGYGNVYRRGGDEYSAIIYADDNTLNRLYREFLEEQSAWSGEIVKEISIAFGSANASRHPNMDILELEKLAEDRMYSYKADYYTKSGKDRRGQFNPYRVLCNSFERIIVVNLETERCTAFKMPEDNRVFQSTYSETYSEWRANLLKSGFVSEDYINEMGNTTSFENLRKRFERGDESMVLRVPVADNSLAGGKGEILLLFQASREKSDDDRILFIYIKNL